MLNLLRGLRRAPRGASPAAGAPGAGGTSARDAILLIKQAGRGEARDRTQQRETETTLRYLETLVTESGRALALTIH